LLANQLFILLDVLDSVGKRQFNTSGGQFRPENGKSQKSSNPASALSVDQKPAASNQQPEAETYNC
jgi:hypothetical protein